MLKAQASGIRVELNESRKHSITHSLLYSLQSQPAAYSDVTLIF